MNVKEMRSNDWDRFACGEAFPCGGEPVRIDIIKGDFKYTVIVSREGVEFIGGNNEGIKIRRIDVEFPNQKSAKTFLKGLPMFNTWSDVENCGFEK